MMTATQILQLENRDNNNKNAYLLGSVRVT